MKILYDEKADALYMKLGSGKPDGVIEITEGVNLDTTSEGMIVGIEIIDASRKIDIKTILTYSLKFDEKKIFPREKVA